MSDVLDLLVTVAQLSVFFGVLVFLASRLERPA
jgi:hypothetical protein